MPTSPRVQDNRKPPPAIVPGTTSPVRGNEYDKPWSMAGRKTTTFLEYVAERLMGPPARKGGTDGESYWCCPFHNDTTPSFHTRPDKPPHRLRWSCFGCGMWGDEADLMRMLLPGEDWPTRRRRLGEWQQEYERANVPAHALQAPETIHLRGGGRLAEKRQDDPCAVATAWADLTEGEREILVAAYRVMIGMRGKSVSLDALARYSFDFVECMREMEEAHRQTCDDPDCDAAVCRAAWGKATQDHLQECRNPECEVAFCRAARSRRMSRVPLVREEHHAVVTETPGSIRRPTAARTADTTMHPLRRY